ncbi:hypothetical protein JNB88_18625 [Rhizobium cauense]|nr:hypothetical protein [Rhizobium cauense]
MSICIADTHAERALSIDHGHDFVVRGDGRVELCLHVAPTPQAVQRQLADDSLMAKIGSSSIMRRN